MSSALANDAIMIDVRTPEKFLQGHIPLAINLPYERIRNNQVTLPKSKTLIVYCDTGGASMQTARLLSNMGYNVINCIGGLKCYTGSLAKGS